MGIIQFVKGFFSAKPVQVQKMVGIPDHYERWEDEQNYGVRADWINPTNELKDFLELYQIQPWVYAAVQAIATSFANVPWQVVDPIKNHEIKDHYIKKFLEKPNPHQTYYEFAELTAMWLELTGNWFGEEVRDNKGRLVAVFPLRPDKIRILPHPKVKIAGYIYEPMPGKEILYSPTELVHIKYQSPLDEYWGISPAYAAQNSIILDMSATTYNKNFFKNSAIPEGVLETDGSISDQAYKRLRLDWMRRHRGNSNAHELAILEEGLKYKPISSSIKDMMMVEMKKISREEILSTFRVPPVMVGLLEFANYSSSREQRKMFYTDNILPKLERYRQAMNDRLMPTNARLRYVIESINSIIEDVQVSTQVAMSLVSHGIMTINEVREHFFARKKVKWGDEPWMPTGLQQWSENPPPGEGGPSLPGTPKLPGSATEAQNRSTPMGETKPSKGKEKVKKISVDFEKLLPAEPDWTNPKQVRDYEVWTFWKGMATTDYKDYLSFFRSYFASQADSVAATLRSAYHPKAGVKKSLDSRVTKMIKGIYEAPYEIYKGEEEYEPEVEEMILHVDFDKAGKELKAKFLPKAKKTIAKHGKATAGSIGAGAVFDLDNKRIADFLKKNAGSQIEDITKGTRQALRRELSKAYNAGEDQDDVMARIWNVFKGDISELRARRIARTEMITLTQFAKLEAGKQAGKTQKRWVSLELPTTREREGEENHIAMHNVVVPIEDKFIVKSRSGEDEMDGPGDPEGSPENVVFCVCTLDFPGEVEEFADLDGLNEKELRELIESERDVEKKDSKLVEEDATGNHVTINLNVERMIQKANPQPPQIINLPPSEIVVTPVDFTPMAKAIDGLAEAMSKEADRPPTRVIVKPVFEVPASPPAEVRIENIIPQEIEKKQQEVVVNISPVLRAELTMPKRVKTVKKEVHRDERTQRVTGTTDTEVEETVDDNEKKEDGN